MTSSPLFIRVLESTHFPHSIGLLYSVFTAFLGFEVNEGEYKVMGLAAFGTPRYRAELDRLIRRHPDGSFELDMDYFSFHREPDRAWSPAFEALLGAPRAPGGLFWASSRRCRREAWRSTPSPSAGSWRRDRLRTCS